MANVGRIFQTVAPIVGAGAGAALGAVGGPAGAAAGMSLGGSAGSMIGSGVNLARGPNEPVGATAQMQQALAAQNIGLERAMSQQGMSSQQTQNIAQLGQEQALQSAEQMATQAQGFSPLDRKILGERLAEEVTTDEQDIAKRVQALDTKAEARNIASIQRGSTRAGRQAGQIRDAEARAETVMTQRKNQMMNQFVADVGNASQAAVQLAGELGGDTDDEPMTATEGEQTLQTKEAKETQQRMTDMAMEEGVATPEAYVPEQGDLSLFEGKTMAESQANMQNTSRKAAAQLEMLSRSFDRPWFGLYDEVDTNKP